jgi:hypothetical protein
MTTILEPALPASARPDRAGIQSCFALTAREIVREVRDRLSLELGEAQLAALARLPKSEYLKVADLLVRSFADRKMGLRELESVARRELTILLIRQTVKRYSEGFLAGDLGPIEYFRRFYIRHFLAGGLAANAICVVDPNLHRVAKKLDVYPQLTVALDEANAGRDF